MVVKKRRKRFRKKTRKPKVKATVTTKKLNRNFFAVLKNDALLLANNFNRKFAKHVQERAKEIIIKQEYDWTPLSKEWLRKKRAEGWDTRIYIRKGWLLKSIKVWEAGGFVFVGPSRGIHKDARMSNQKLARIHEFGTEYVPARPLWRPLLSVIVRERRTFLREYKEGVRLARKRLGRMIRQGKVRYTG